MSATVLVVDDEQDIVLLCRIALDLAGFTVLEAGSGEEALTLLETACPDVMLLDVRLPGMDGWEVLDRLHALPAFEKRRIIVFSAHKSSAGRALEAGCRAMIPKPFRPDDLVRTVRSVVEN